MAIVLSVCMVSLSLLVDLDMTKRVTVRVLRLNRICLMKMDQTLNSSFHLKRLFHINLDWTKLWMSRHRIRINVTLDQSVKLREFWSYENFNRSLWFREGSQSEMKLRCGWRQSFHTSVSCWNNKPENSMFKTRITEAIFQVSAS